MSRLFLLLALGMALGGPQLQSLAASFFEAVQAPATTNAGSIFDPDGGVGDDGEGLFDSDGSAELDHGAIFDPNG